MIKAFGTVPSFASQNWRAGSHSHKNSTEKPAESIPMQILKPKLREQDKPKSDYFSFPRVRGWSDYDDAASLRTQGDTPALQSLKASQKALIKQPPLPKHILGWNLSPILQAPLRWLLSVRKCMWNHSAPQVSR